MKNQENQCINLKKSIDFKKTQEDKSTETEYSDNDFEFEVKECETLFSIKNLV